MLVGRWTRSKSVTLPSRASEIRGKSNPVFAALLPVMPEHVHFRRSPPRSLTAALEAVTLLLSLSFVHLIRRWWMQGPGVNGQGRFSAPSGLSRMRRRLARSRAKPSRPGRLPLGNSCRRRRMRRQAPAASRWAAPESPTVQSDRRRAQQSSGRSPRAQCKRPRLA